MATNPIICALDTTNTEKALKLAVSLKGHVGAIKLGLEFFTANGAEGVKKLEKAGIPIFLDLKFHDIPNTVVGAIRGLSDLNIFMTTVHTAGGFRMMSDAAGAISDLFQYQKSPLVVGVTVLTSLDAGDLKSIGADTNVGDQVVRLANLAHKAGLNGVVCSPHEIKRIRESLAKNFTLVVPGIRPNAFSLANALLDQPMSTAKVKNDDQKRVMTPKEAMTAGATYLVIGRPITESEDPAKAAADIFASL